MNNINPFGMSILPSMSPPMQAEPVAIPAPVDQSQVFPDPVQSDGGLDDTRGTLAPTGLTLAGPVGALPTNGGLGMFFNPIVQKIMQHNNAEMQNKIQPYLQEITTLTNTTFPDVDFSGGGLRGGIGSIGGKNIKDILGALGGAFQEGNIIK